MRKKLWNKEHVEGRVYDHNLAIKTVQNKDSQNFGKEFIGGTLDVATDEDCINVITINFTYVTEKTSKGGVNATFTALKNIIENGKTIVFALYSNDMFAGLQTAVCNGESIDFEASAAYTNVKVMVWNDLKGFKPLCDVEIVK